MGNTVTSTVSEENGITQHTIVSVVSTELTRELAAAINKSEGKPAGFDCLEWMKAKLTSLAEAGNIGDIAVGRPDSAVTYVMEGDLVCFVARERDWEYQWTLYRTEKNPVDRGHNPKKERPRIAYNDEYLVESATPGYIAAECEEHFAFEGAATSYLVVARVTNADSDLLKVEIVDCLPPGDKPKVHGPLTVNLSDLAFAGYC